jgi:hypothetical protein
VEPEPAAAADTGGPPAAAAREPEAAADTGGPPAAAEQEPEAAAVAVAPPIEALRDAETEIKARICRYGQEHDRMGGIVFGDPEAAGPAKLGEQISLMASPFALTIGLPSGRCLTLFPPSMDGGLVAHRISRSLNTEALCVFEAQDPEGVYQALKPYM